MACKAQILEDAPSEDHNRIVLIMKTASLQLEVAVEALVLTRLAARLLLGFKALKLFLIA